jgi:hypothetical protein
MAQNDSIRKFLFHSPRLLAVLFAVFLVFQAAMVFNDPISSIGEQTLRFIVKLLLPAIVIGSLAVAWKKNHLGGLIFITLGIGFVLVGWKSFTLAKLFFAGGVMVFIGVLFLLNKQNQSSSEADGKEDI